MVDAVLSTIAKRKPFGTFRDPVGGAAATKLLWGLYDTHECADGRYVAVGCVELPIYKQMLGIRGLDDPELPFQLDRTGWAELEDGIGAQFKEHTRDEWPEVFAGTDSCVSPVLTPWKRTRTRTTRFATRSSRSPGPPARTRAPIQSHTRPLPAGPDLRRDRGADHAVTVGADRIAGARRPHATTQVTAYQPGRLGCSGTRMPTAGLRLCQCR